MIPDLVVFGAAGFDALAPAMRIYAPLTLLAILVTGSRAAAAAAAVGIGKAARAHGLGVLVQSVIIAVLLR